MKIRKISLMPFFSILPVLCLTAFAWAMPQQGAEKTELVAAGKIEAQGLPGSRKSVTKA